MPGSEQHTRKRGARDAGNLLAAFAILAFYITLGAGSVKHGRDQDFLNLYTGAVLARDGRLHELHDPGVQLAVEQSIKPGRTYLVPFVRPHFYAAALRPLASLPHETAHRVWMALQAAFMAAFFVLLWREFGSEAVVLAALFAPPVMGSLQGQDNWMLGLIAIAGLRTLRQGHDFSGGAIWSLALLKFHLAPGLALAALVARRGRALAGFATGGAVLAAVSLALGGWAGAACYWRMLSNPLTQGLYPSREKMSNLQGLAAALQVPDIWVYATLGAAVVLMLALGLRGAQWWKQFSLALGGWLVLAPHVYLYDLTILLPAIVWSVRECATRGVRWSALLLTNPLFVFAVMASDKLQPLIVPALIAWLLLLSRDRPVADVSPATPESSRPAPA